MASRVAALLVMLAVATAASGEESLIDSLAAMMEGTYSIDENGYRMTDRRIRIAAPDIGDCVFYLQVNQGPELDVYRQRILVFEADGDQVTQRAYSLKEPEGWVDSGAHELAGLLPEAVERTLPDGCETTWTAVDNGFRGYTDPASCTIISSRTGKPRSIESETVLTKDTLSLVERGFDEQGKQLFGTEPGQSLQLPRN